MLNILVSTSISLIVVVAYTYVAKYESKIYFRNQDSAYLKVSQLIPERTSPNDFPKNICVADVVLPVQILTSPISIVLACWWKCFKEWLWEFTCASLSLYLPLSYWRKNCQCKMIKIDNFSKMISMITRYFYFVGLFNFEILI